MTIKGSVVRTLSEIGMAAPWRSAIERTLVSLGHKYPTNRTVLSFCRHFGAQLIDHEGTEFVRVATFESGGKMCCGGGELLAELSIFYYFCGTITGQHEDELRVVQLLKRLLKEGDIFFDLGANFGFYSFFAAPLCGKSGAVHAFEANPSLIPHLRRSIDLNAGIGRIALNPVAVGSNSGIRLPLYGTDRIGCSSLYRHEWLDHKCSVEVPVVTIDEYVRDLQIDRIDVMKIDIEGAELDALRGMEKTFGICAPKAIICELTILPDENDLGRHHPEIRQRASSAADPYELADFLRQKGYQLCEIDCDGRISPSEMLQSTSDFKLKVTNVAFVLPELRRLRPDLFVFP